MPMRNEALMKKRFTSGLLYKEILYHENTL
jgi:hypothetical protein